MALQLTDKLGETVQVGRVSLSRLETPFLDKILKLEDRNERVASEFVSNRKDSTIGTMLHAFDSERRKLERAERHFADLEQAISEFARKRPYEAVIEAHPKKADHTVQSSAWI